MNYARITLASLGAFVAYMVVGGVLFAVIPALKAEFAKYPAVYRSQQGQMSHMPVGMAAMLLSIVVLAVLYARMYSGGSGIGSGIKEGAIFGVLVGLFAIGSFVLHNYVNLNIGVKITAFSAIAYLLEWTVVGIVIGLIYKPVS